MITAAEFLHDNLYFDIHGHQENTLPRIARILTPGQIPKDVKISELKNTGVDGFVLCAIGDPNSFRKTRKSAFDIVLKQLSANRARVLQAQGVVAKSAGDIRKAAAESVPVFVLGIEGGDFIDEELSQLPAIYNLDVRVLAPLHYSKNIFGSISFGWGGRVVPESEQTGLTTLGAKLVHEARQSGILLDLAHADERTVLDVLDNTDSPVMCSHTGPRALQDFPRYLSDTVLKAIANAGGLVGMWPFFYKGAGIPNLETFAHYSRYLADLIGPNHLGLGTDINGVPGNMQGYKNLKGAAALIQSLIDAGFDENELKMICGENFLKVFAEATQV